MFKRNQWQKAVEEAWSERSVVWLYGVRRVGKTFLCKSLPDIEYFDCELPRVRGRAIVGMLRLESKPCCIALVCRC